MTVTTTMKRAGDAVAAQGRQLIDEAPKPLYAWIGANTVVLARARQLPVRAQEQARAVQSRLEKLPTLPQTVPGQAKDVSGKALSGAQTIATGLADRFVSTYVGLVERGEQVVTAVRTQPSTKQATARVKTARSQTKGAATSTRKATTATVRAVRAAADKTG